jgi:hypothetical protein
MRTSRKLVGRRPGNSESLRGIDRASKFVSSVNLPLTDPVEEAVRALESAERDGVVLRLLGGVAFYLRCPSARRGNLARVYGDIDFIGHVRQSAKIKRLFVGLGYLPRERFNALQGNRWLGFLDSTHQRRADVFLDVFEMCHLLGLRSRLEIDRLTIPLADLLATKLQIVEINEKDMRDVVCLLIDHEIGDGDLPEMVNGAYLAKICGDDWGLFKTFTKNLDLLAAEINRWSLSDAEKESVFNRISRLRTLLQAAPKSLAWRMRAAIGERVPWYELPEADAGVIPQVQSKEN